MTSALTSALNSASAKDPFAKALLEDVKSPAAAQLGDEMGGAGFISHLASVKDPSLKPFIYRLAGTNDSSVLLKLLKLNVTPWLAGLLAAGIISAVMGSDCHQILALSTMFTKDVFDYYGKGSRITESTNVLAGKIFIIVLNTLAYLIALGKPQIFELATSYAFAGFASLSPIMIGALLAAQHQIRRARLNPLGNRVGAAPNRDWPTTPAAWHGRLAFPGLGNQSRRHAQLVQFLAGGSDGHRLGHSDVDHLFDDAATLECNSRPLFPARGVDGRNAPLRG